MQKVFRKKWFIISQYYYRMRFGSVGKNSIIIKPVQLDHVRSIYLEDNVFIAEGAWLLGNSEGEKVLSIKSKTTIGHYCHIVAKESVTIEEDVLIADKVFITDCAHSYTNINESVQQQKVKFLGPVVIGSGSWLGENVCVCGASIGKHCVIGANSVVNRDIPDYSVAVGAPARVVKKFDFHNNTWIKVE